MYVASVALNDFRNYRSASVALSPTVNLLVGANGQGKSNLLEAIGLLSVGKSVRGALDADMVRWGTEGSRIACELTGASVARLEMQIQPGQRKQVRVDGAALPSLSDLVGIVRTVHFAPDVIDQQFRSPSGRRRMVDILISQIEHPYLEALKRYRKIVHQVNMLYKQPEPSASEMDAWERQLAAVAVEVVRRRMGLLGRLQDAVQAHFVSLFGLGSLELRMRTTLPVDGTDDAVEACAESLHQSRPQAIKVGFLTRGAHRDRFEVLLDGHPVEAHASQGQVKGAYFAWKLAEGDAIEELTGARPLWLVDDPFSEMDRRRALRLLEVFIDRGQVILTTARDSDLDLETRGFARWQVHDGTIEHIA